MTTPMPYGPGLEGRWLITGGSGFLGRAVLRRARRDGWPARFTIYSRDETKQWELKHRYPEATCVLGDVARDEARLISLMAGHDGVIDAAAVKYIPEAEHNVFETVDVNVVGSRNIATAAIAAGVPKVVGISTDKASAPLNLYGLTKGIKERLFSEANRLGRTRFVNVRYGNVVGSTGSVIPVFMKQLAESGRLRITDPRMTRFWLSVDEAIDLILWALAEAHERPGYTFIGACPAMTIPDLGAAVYALWRQPSLWAPPDEVPIDFTGIRPGEKLHESLFNEQEAPRVQQLHGLQQYRENGTTTGFIMAPATAPADVLRTEGYSSDKPVRWVGHAEMIEMIRDARDV